MTSIDSRAVPHRGAAALPPQTANTRAGKGNSDQRKEQNRIASKHYREKSKKKLAYLQQLLDESETLPAPVTDPLPPVVSNFQTDILTNPEVLPSTLPSSESHSDPFAWLPATQPPTTHAAVPLLYPEMGLYSGNDSTVTSVSAEDFLFYDIDPMLNVGDFATAPFAPGTQTPIASIAPVSWHTRKNNQPVVHPMLQCVQTMLPRQKEQTSQALLQGGNVQEVEDDDADSHRREHLQVADRRTDHRTDRWTDRWARGPPAVMTMHLQCRRLGFFTAVLQNSEACGLPDPTAMLAEDSCQTEQDKAQSPFALAADEAHAVVRQGPAQIAAVVAAVLQNLDRLGRTPPRDLQPVDAQILVAHHPYIDTIPFRGFRARILALLAAMELTEDVAIAAQQSANLLDSRTASTTANINVPRLLDEDELCYDMHVADGLVCWGSQVGDGGAGQSAQAMRDRRSARDMGADVPWDMRSWEPQVWFLKKYWYLVGGWDDDMWRSCRWWHSMRGEDLAYSVFTA